MTFGYTEAMGDVVVTEAMNNSLRGRLASSAVRAELSA